MTLNNGITNEAIRIECLKLAKGHCSAAAKIETAKKFYEYIKYYESNVDTLKLLELAEIELTKSVQAKTVLLNVYIEKLGNSTTRKEAMAMYDMSCKDYQCIYSKYVERLDNAKKLNIEIPVSDALIKAYQDNTDVLIECLKMQNMYLNK